LPQLGIWEIRASAATQPLIVALQPPASDLRLAAITALGEIQDPRAVEPRGSPAAEDLLEKTLGEYGDLEMAEDFQACGNIRLRAVAEKWKADHDFSVDLFRTEQPVK
jgi:HEAT repeat protein